MDHSSGICFDDILAAVGNDGRYQKHLIYIFIATMHTFSSFLILPSLLQASVPDHWCHVPGRPENVSLELWKNMTIPRNINEDQPAFSSCIQYETPMTFFNNSENLKIVNCSNGWEFDKTGYEETISTREQWVCEDSQDRSVWLSVGIFGNMIGTILCNSLSDIVGRKPMVVFTTQLYAVFGILRLFVTSKFGIMITMLISNMCFPALLNVSFILVMEQVSSDFRARTTFISFFTWTIGMCILPLIAWLTKSWVYLGIATSAPFFIYLSTYWLLHESPRWLASQGRIDEAESILKKIARTNGKKPPRNLLQMLKSLPKKSEKTNILENSFIELLKYPTIRKRTLLLSMSYICNNLIYYGLMYNNENMVGNEFLNFFLLGITELPSNILGWVCSQFFGRRMTSAGFIGICTVTIFIVICLPASYAYLATSLLISAKAIVNVSFFVIYLQFVEIYPTSHRSSGTGFSTVLCSLSGISVPYIIYIRNISPSLPFIILVIIGIIGVIVGLFLPETLDFALPQNISEAESNLVSQKFWSYHGKRLKLRKKKTCKGIADESRALSDTYHEML